MSSKDFVEPQKTFAQAKCAIERGLTELGVPLDPRRLEIGDAGRKAFEDLKTAVDSALAMTTPANDNEDSAELRDKAGIDMVRELMQMLPWDREQAFHSGEPWLRELCDRTFPNFPITLRLHAGKVFATITIDLINSRLRDA